MKGIIQGVRRLAFVAVILLSTISLKADPVVIGEGPPRHEAVIPIILAILLEAICVLLVLRHRRKPRLLILWLLGMHLLTYPLFFGWLWLSYGLHPVLAVVIGEGVIVLLEGSLIWLICHFLSSAKSDLPLPTISKSLFASLIGNICSATAFPFVLWLYRFIASSMGASILD